MSESAGSGEPRPAADPQGAPEDAAPPAGLAPAPEAPAPPGDPRFVERLSGRVVPVWLVGGLVGWVLLAGVAVTVFVSFGDALPVDRAVARPAGLAALALTLAWSLIAPPLAWRRWRFSIDERMLWARHGIVVLEEKAIPISRLQHVDLTRGPLERLFGLATLIVFTAGTESATFRLPGLPVERASALRDRILAARGDDVI